MRSHLDTMATNYVASLYDHAGEPYVYAPNVYPFQHIHPAEHQHGSKPMIRTSPKKTVSALAAAAPAPIPVRALAGPRTRQEIGYGPFHAVKNDARRFDFSRPRTDTSRPLSQINVPQSTWTQQQGEAEEANPIKLFHGRTYEENAQRHRGRAQNVQSENNDPLSAHAHVTLERYGIGADSSAGGLFVEASIQPQVSASYLQKQTAQKLASKQEQLARYHRDVQERLKKRNEEAQRREAERRKTLPTKVQALVYAITPRQREADENSALVEQQASPPQQSLEEFLAQGSPSKHVQERERARSASPHDAAGRVGSGQARPRTAAAATARARAGMSKAESLAYLRQVRKEESERSREKVRAARAAGVLGPHGSASGLPEKGVAFGHGLFPRDTPLVTPRQGDERALIALERRHPHAFSVRQQLEADEPVEEKERVLHVPNPQQRKKAAMSDAVAGRRLPKKEARSGAGGGGGAGANSAYRRLVLERLHALQAHLGHPLPPLCACGFTPKEEYELLFAYGGVSSSALAAAPPAQASQPAFNLSTVISHPTADPSIHTHTHAHDRVSAQQAALASHVALDATRHGFQHKHNCQFYAQPEAYVKAMANLLHTLEDQQQI